ncbi:MAG: M4 family metallopeptidase [Bacteroidetes bacterium]|nr:M4 family metallopeptidase [Bacteroidota bacterium]
MHRRILLFIFIGIFAGNIMAQKNSRLASNALSTSNQSPGIFYYGNINEPPRAIEFKAGTVTTSDFKTNINHHLNISTELTFVETESNKDHLGMSHHLLQQYYKDTPLEGMVYRVHEKEGYVTSVNGKAVRNINLDIQTLISEEQAFSLAVKYLNTKDNIFRPGKKLIVSKGYTFTPESFFVAFQFDIDVSLIERWRISIDAHSGEMLNKISLVNNCFKEKEPPLTYGTGTGLTRYYGNQTIRVEKYDNGGSILQGQTEHGGNISTYDFHNASVLALVFGLDVPVYDFYSSNNVFNNSYQRPAVSVQWAAEKAYEYYFTKHSRNSFDNKGGIIKSYVHLDQNYNNAFWTGKLLAFGDGSNNNPLVELDVVSHELTHGVTQYEAQLQYYQESGALNESFSDILGKAVEFSVFGDTATWQLARHYKYGGLRDMSNPNLRNQPDTWLGDLWYTGYDDSGGVHTNSGVQNFWYYLLCKGGSGVNDKQFSYSVNSIGMDAAANIVYRNLTEYLTYTSDYLDSRIGSLLAAADLYGKNSFTYQQVANAWDAVGVIAQPIITGQKIYDITATTVKIKGSMLPRGDTVTYHFEYGTTPAFGSSSSIYNFTDSIKGIVTALQPETKYYLRIVATNENGSSYGTSMEFTTISLAPLVKIKQTVDVTETNATVYGKVNPNSLPTSFYFEYGTTPAFGLVTPSYPLPDTTEFLSVSAPIANLQPRQTYYYRLIATNGFASSTSESASFFTAVKPVITSYTPSAAPIGTVITITGQNFNSVPEKNIISFGATKATVESSNSTQIKVKVPAGASLGPISILDAESGLIAESVQKFVPTFAGDFQKGNLTMRVGINDLYVYQTLVEDMDKDGRPDIVARHYHGFSVFQNVNQGGDITDQSFNRSTFPTEYTLGTFSLVDFDGNGLKDIVGFYRTSLRIYPNLSVPGYIFFGPPVDLTVESSWSYAYNDFDQDGHIDIAASYYVRNDSSSINIYRNQNPKGFLLAENFVKQAPVSLHGSAYYLFCDDLNNDGKPDLAGAGNNNTAVPILKNNSQSGSFQFVENIAPISIGQSIYQYVIQDLNQDGQKDITLNQAGSQISDLDIIENNGASPAITFTNPIAALTGYAKRDVQPGDINGDGKIDLLVTLPNRKFIFLKNKSTAGEHLSASTLEKFAEFGTPDANINASEVYVKMTVSDLNGDGRPEVINANSYYYGPHDGYQMEIWQNSAPNCLDPSLITVSATNNSATIKLPPNTTLDQFEIDYAPANSSYWTKIYSTTLYYLYYGSSYQLRARAKCHLGYTDYSYINFVTDCVDTNNFSVSKIDINNVTLSAYNIGSFEIQYSLTGKDQWTTLQQYSTQISNLSPGTTYDLRFRGRCLTLADFNYKQFTTLCPNLSALYITDLVYNSGKVNWTSVYGGKAILEYSADNVKWTLIDATQTMSLLTPGKQYSVRGKLACTNLNSGFIYTSFITPCPKVSMLQADNVTLFSAKINWVDESKTGSYTLTYAMTANGKVATVETNSTSFTLVGLSPGTQYSVSVAPKCTSKVFTSAVFNTACYVPSDLSIDAITYTTADLSWNANFSNVPFLVDYSISGSNVWLTKETTSTALSLDKLRPGTKYEARVHIKCLSETAPYVSQFLETKLYDETVLSPNPTDNKATIYPSKNLIGNYFNIYDNTGRIAAFGELLDYTINMSDFPPGIYNLKIDGEKPIRIVKY